MNIKRIIRALINCLNFFGKALGLGRRRDFIIKEGVLVNYFGWEEPIVIPRNLGITAIGGGAFSHSYHTKSITIPAEVGHIENSFYCCFGLTDIIVDERNTAYSSSEGILFSKDRTVFVQYPLGREGAYTVPDGVLHIEDHAFFNCEHLTDLSMPASVSSIPVGAFIGCRSLANIIVDERNTAYSSIGGVLFNKDRTVLIQCPTAREGAYTVPDGVLHIKDFAFSGNRNLTAIAIPASVSTIRDSEFGGCSSLVNITVDERNGAYSSSEGVLFNKDGTVLIHYPDLREGAYRVPDSVATIERSAFNFCRSLTSITIPSGVASIEVNAFLCCYNLASITISPGVASIGDGAFCGCESLINIAIPPGVVSIGDDAFRGCKSLISITIPPSVISIGDIAFDRCAMLKTVTLSRHTQIGKDAFPDGAELVYSD